MTEYMLILLKRTVELDTRLSMDSARFLLATGGASDRKDYECMTQ
jgi:hypothetical protein